MKPNQYMCTVERSYFRSFYWNGNTSINGGICWYKGWLIVEKMEI